MSISHYNGHRIKLVRPLSTVDNTRDYARVSHSTQWSNYNFLFRLLIGITFCFIATIKNFGCRAAAHLKMKCEVLILFSLAS